MKLLERTDNEPDRRFKTGISPELREEFATRIADELRAASRPEKTYLIPETVALTMRLNELKNRMRAGCDGMEDRHEYARSAATLYRLLQSMDIPVTRSNSGVFAADLCHASRNWIELCLDGTDLERFFQC